MAISKNNLIRSKRINGEWMDMALNLAKKGKGKVPGRPLVGCVIVDKNKPNLFTACVLNIINEYVKINNI